MQDYRHSWTSSTTNARTGIFEAEGGERNGRLAQLTKPPRPTDKRHLAQLMVTSSPR
jgi:hypothetical protein